MRPHFCNIKDVPFVLLTIRLRNQLDVHGPRRILAVHDGLIQVLTGIVSVLSSSGQGFHVSEILNALVCLEMILDKESLTSVIDPLEGIGTIAIHVTITSRGASVGILYGDGMDRLRSLTEEVPHCVGIEEILNWMRLHSMEEVRCLHWVSKEENWEVDSNHVIISVFSVELQSVPSDVPEQIRGASLPNGCRESSEELGSLADLTEELGFTVHGDVMSNFEVPMGTLALCMSCSLRNPLSVELLDLVDKVEIL